MARSRPDEASQVLRELLFRRDLAMTRQRAAVGRQLGVDETELRTLMHLLHRGPLTATRLAALVDLSSAGMTYVVRRLSEQGWISRAPHPTDRRSQILELSPALRADLPAQLEPAPYAIQDAAQRLTDDVLRELTTFLEDVAEQSEAANEASGANPPAHASPTRLVPSRWM